MDIRLTLVLGALLPFQALAQETGAPQTGRDILTASQTVLFRNYALSACLGAAFPSIAAEADAAASGYVQYGSGPYEAYQQAASLARAFLQQTYVSQSGAQMSVMKCIDFSHSKELDMLIERYFPPARTRKR